MEENIVNETDESIIDIDLVQETIEEQFEKIRTQAMLLGFQVAIKSILDKIIEVETKPGKRSMNDYKRLIKDIRGFCQTGLSRKVNLDGTTSPVDKSETVQN